MRPQRGFTLVELVVVILLLAVVAVTAGARFVGPSQFATQIARDQAITQLRQLQLASMRSDAYRDYEQLSAAQQLAVECRRVEVNRQRFGSPFSVTTQAGQQNCPASSTFQTTTDSDVHFELSGDLDANAPLYFDLLGRPIQLSNAKAPRRVCGGDSAIAQPSQVCRFDFIGEQRLSLCMNNEGYLYVC
uniref:prepilin-type N-terminal cleavage/methylation domain-containing protein n=1 Tax=Thaumasiovibrio occultus TaxID=1891184 RepID=UPI000B356212|nr:prepilin-type N-terminal cleavage/methylation domain-containing protein [Thaumasiovibrio occultus]